MRRLAAVAIASGALVTGMVATTTPAVADAKLKATVSEPSAKAAVSEPTAKAAAVNFTLKKSGLGATTAWGRYYWGSYGKYRTRVVDAKIRDNKRGRYSCIHLVVYGRKSQNLRTEHLYLWNQHGAGTTARVRVASYRLGAMAMRECEGYRNKRGFVETRHGGWRWFK